MRDNYDEDHLLRVEVVPFKQIMIMIPPCENDNNDIIISSKSENILSGSQ